jgi:hypothetical protein
MQISVCKLSAVGRKTRKRWEADEHFWEKLMFNYYLMQRTYQFKHNVKDDQINVYAKTANIKFASSRRTYSAWRTSWYSASTDVE